MTFALPHLLWLLAAPVLLLAWEILRSRGLGPSDHPKILRARAGMGSVQLAEPGATPAPLGRRRILLCAGLAFGVLALARPQWGTLDEPVFDQSREIIIALDLSRSMTSPDVRPSRLERSKLLIESLLDHLRGERVGLVVFSGTAFLQSPISADYEILREFLPSLGPDFLPEGGTNYRQLLDTSLEAFSGGSAADRYLIILSDGEATDDNWKDRVDELEKRGIRVIGLGVGTRAGAMIPDGSGGFMKDESGAVVLSRLESGTLRDLASATHGVYRDASEWVDLPALLKATVDSGKKGRFVERNNLRHVERYQWALAQALICLAASFLLEFPVKPKARAVPLAARRMAAALALALGAAHALNAADSPEPQDPAASLSKIVARLSAQPSRAGIDWAEMANETVRWGERLKSSGKPVPEGPVNDALAAADRGEALDPKADDWPKVRDELHRLLDKPEQKKQDDQKKDQEKQDKQQKQENSGSSGNPGEQGQQQPESGKPKDPQQAPTPQPQSQDARPRDKAFGNMRHGSAPTPQPQSPQGMQKVGSPSKAEPNDPAAKDPELAVPLQKLQQLKDGDSPAELFGLMRKGEPTPPPSTNGKNW
jgi:Ca-activated chloride channel homolog